MLKKETWTNSDIEMGWGASIKKCWVGLPVWTTCINKLGVWGLKLYFLKKGEGA